MSHIYMTLIYFMNRGRAPVYLLHGLALDHSIWLEMADTYADQAQFIM
jgi:hypothetical protein